MKYHANDEAYLLLLKNITTSTPLWEIFLSVAQKHWSQWPSMEHTPPRPASLEQAQA